MIAEASFYADPLGRDYSDNYQAEISAPDTNSASGGVLLRALDLLPMGVIAVNRNCRIEASNRMARLTLENSEIIADVSGYLSLTVKSQERRVRDAVRSACEVEGSRFALRISRPFGRPLMLLVQSATESRGAMPAEPMALIFLAESAWTHRVDEAVLRELFGFTPAEARVAALLMQGKSVENAAVALGITENTTRNHLKRLFAKTKTNKQGELVQLLLKSPALMTLQLESSHILDEGSEYRAS